MLNFLYDNKKASSTGPDTPLIHTSFTYSKLNMDDYSVLAGPLGYVDSTQEVEWNSLHAQKMSFLILNLQFCV